MAAFKEHVTVSSVLGAGYAATLAYLGLDWSHSLLAGLVCGFSGMLPDLDSDSGRPIREIFGLTAAIVPLLMLPRLQEAGFTIEQAILLLAAIYIAIRFGLSSLFKRLTVHRGMFHSVPAALIAAEIGFLAHHCPKTGAAWVLGGGVLLGFLSHLVLDEIYSIDSNGVKKRSAGTALKFASRNKWATTATYTILGVLTYVVAMDAGFVRPLHVSINWFTNGMHAGSERSHPEELSPRTVRPASTGHTPLDFTHHQDH